MKTAVIYARYSSDKQTEQSIEGQLHVCREYALKNDIVIVDTYIDRAMTGKNDRREDFQRMLRDSQKKLWDYVLVYKLDRFSRNKYETAIHKKTLRDNGIRLLSATENIPESPEGIILESLLEGMAEYYSAELAQKVSRGMHESKVKGNFCGGVVLYGYRVENKKVFIHETEAPIVQRIFTQYASGRTITQIADELNAQGIRCHDRPFRFNSIYRILRNERYTGVFHAGGEVFTNTYAPIIDTDLYTQVNTLINNNRRGRTAEDCDYLLRGKVRCGYCGSPINGESGTSKSGKVCHYYKCHARKKTKKCHKKTVRKEHLEDLVLSVIEQLFSDKHLQAMYADRIVESYEEERRKSTVLNRLNEDLNGVNAAIDNLLKALEAGIITESTQKRLQELETRKADLSVKIENEKHEYSCFATSREILTFFSDILKKSGKQLVQLLIKKIILYDDRMEITFNHTRCHSVETKDRGLVVHEGEYTLGAGSEYATDMHVKLMF